MIGRFLVVQLRTSRRAKSYTICTMCNILAFIYNNNRCVNLMIGSCAKYIVAKLMIWASSSS